jgi:hypothetical protein
MRRGSGRRVDANHEVIVEAFRKMGWSVQSLAEVGNGCPDLIVGKHFQNLLVEIKGPKGIVTMDQMQWAANWKGSMRLVRTVADVEQVTREFSD